VSESNNEKRKQKNPHTQKSLAAKNFHKKRESEILLREKRIDLGWKSFNFHAGSRLMAMILSGKVWKSLLFHVISFYSDVRSEPRELP
jgi:hypothetical protein